MWLRTPLITTAPSPKPLAVEGSTITPRAVREGDRRRVDRAAPIRGAPAAKFHGAMSPERKGETAPREEGRGRNSFRRRRNKRADTRSDGAGAGIPPNAKAQGIHDNEVLGCWAGESGGASPLRYKPRIR